MQENQHLRPNSKIIAAPRNRNRNGPAKKTSGHDFARNVGETRRSSNFFEDIDMILNSQEFIKFVSKRNRKLVSHLTNEPM
ncbi:hypothetical protein D3C71_89140 [compost metagenome]